MDPASQHTSNRLRTEEHARSEGSSMGNLWQQQHAASSRGDSVVAREDQLMLFSFDNQPRVWTMRVCEMRNSFDARDVSNSLDVDMIAMSAVAASDR